MSQCPYCDPEYFVVYGKCVGCGAEARSRLIDFPEISLETRLKSLTKQLSKMQKAYMEPGEYENF